MKLDTIKNNGRCAEILLVDDNYGDVLLTKKAFANGSFVTHISVANDGLQAMAMLRREPGYEHQPIPDLILLDLNLPRMNGEEILNEIKSDEGLKHIPVIVLTSSRAEMDIVKSYNLHANSYIAKSCGLDQFRELIKLIEEYWFAASILSNEVST